MSSSEQNHVEADAIKIVIVEDHHATRKGLAFELSTEGDLTVCGAAASQEEGLSMMQELKPHVVLLDLHLPDSKGPKSLVNSFCTAGYTKVVVFTGDTRTAIMQLVLESGVHGYLLKSEPGEVIAQAIRKVVAGEHPVISSELLATDHNRLTPTEKHLLRLLARGMKYQDIASHRVTSPETVRKQVEQLMAKVGLSTREELIAWAVESGYSKMEV